MQAEQAGESAGRGMFQTLTHIARTEGLPALYSGCAITMTGVAPYAGLKFGTYELLKTLMRERLGVEEADLPGIGRVACGSFAGVLAYSFVYPFDVVRRRMQTHSGSKPLYSGVFDAFSTIARTEGIRKGLFRGLSLNYIRVAPNVAIEMSVYDIIKGFLISPSSTGMA